MEVYIQGCLDLLFARLKRHSSKGDVVDISSWTVAFGEQLGHLRTETDVVGLRKGIYDAFIIMSVMGHFWGQSRLLNNRFVNSTLAALGNSNPLNKFQIWALQKVLNRLSENKLGAVKEREDFLSHFVNMKTPEGEPATTREILIENM